MEEVLHDDLMSADAIADPYGYFGALRASDPVHWNSKWGGWIVTRYDDSLAAMRDPRLKADTVTPYFENKLTDRERTKWHPLFDVLSSWIVFMDPPDHSRLRRLMNRAFTPRVVEAMREDIARLANDLLDDIEERESFDIVSDFAFPLPANVISVMLGARPDDLWIMRDWSRDAVTVSLGGVGVEDRRQRAQTALLEFKEYLRPVLADRRANPRENDLITELLAAQEEGEKLTVDEILASAMLLLIAGHETTQNLIANSVVTLLNHPDQFDLLRDEPTHTRNAVEEVLRYDAPVKATIRQVSEPMEIRGQQLAENDRVLVVFSSANRDPDKYANADEFDIMRGDASHLTFGQGIHFCLGAPLARLETQVALEALMQRLPKLELNGETIEYEPKLITRAPVAVPVRR